MNLKKVNRALISVSDKSELSKILKVLKKFKVEIKFYFKFKHN